MSNRSLRVLFISHAYVVGVNQGKLDAIAQTGIEVGLLAPSNWKALEWNRLLKLEKPYSNIQIYSAPVTFSGRGGGHFYNPWQVWQVINDFQPDIIQVEEEVFSLCSFEIAICARLTGKPLVVFGWENMQRQLPILRRWTCQFVLNTAKLLIPGNLDGEKVLRSWGYTGAIAVMPQLGVDTSFFVPRSPNLGEQEFQIGFLGRLVPEKGVDLILAAVARLKNKGLNCRVIFCGSGASETALRQEAEKLQIADLITWRGAIRHEEAPQELSKFDVLVLPSRSIATWKEQFGHVLIEAMAMGIPVVGSNCGEIPNVIGRSDLVFAEEDVDQLTTILERMISNPNWRKEVANYGIERVEQYYSHQKIAERLVELWEMILTEKVEIESEQKKQKKTGEQECV